MENGSLALVQIALRVIGIIVCVNKARSLKRNALGWGAFGFLLPIVAMVAVYCMKPLGLRLNK